MPNNLFHTEKDILPTIQTLIQIKFFSNNAHSMHEKQEKKKTTTKILTIFLTNKLTFNHNNEKKKKKNTSSSNKQMAKKNVFMTVVRSITILNI